MGELDLILFLTASLALIVVPGPENILVLTRGVARGRGAALVSAAAGLCTLLAQAASAFSVVKFAEAACMICPGVRTFLVRGSAVPSGAAPVSLKSVFVQGVA